MPEPAGHERRQQARNAVVGQDPIGLGIDFRQLNGGISGAGVRFADQMNRPSNATFPLPTRITFWTFNVWGSILLSTLPPDEIHTDPSPASAVTPPTSLIVLRTDPYYRPPQYSMCCCRSGLYTETTERAKRLPA